MMQRGKIVPLSLVLAGCTVASPPAAPQARPLQHVEATYADACLADEDPDTVRGLVIEKGSNGAPAIHVGLFRKVDNQASGELAFDMQALAKLKAGLSGSSSTSEYSLSMKDSLQTNAPKINLDGVWKRVSTLDDTIAYADLVGMPWSCDHLHAGHGFKFWSQYGEKFISDCAHGKRHAKVDLLAGPAAPAPNDWRVTLPSGEERLSALHDWAKTSDELWKKCDPSGQARMAFDNPMASGPENREAGRYQIYVFSASTNPLYPAPDFYNLWSDRGDVKTAFQIYWLITQQKAKSGAK
jgi:hypothetical protein